MARKFGFGIEDLQDGDGDGDDVVLPAADEITDLTEFEDSDIEGGDDADVLEEAIDQVEDVAAGLEAIKEQMLIALSNGGMNKDTAAFAQLAITNTVGKWIAVAPTAMPSMESFDEAGGRMAATGYALEGVGNLLVSAWGKITSLAEKWFESAIALFRKLSTTAKALSSRAKVLGVKAAAATGAPAEKTLKVSSSTGKNLAVGGKVDNLDANLAHLAKALNAIKEESPTVSILESVTKDIAAINTKDVEDAVAKFDELAKKHSVDAAVKQFEAMSTFKFKEIESPTKAEGISRIVSEELIGGRHVEVYFEAGYDDMLCAVTASLSGTKTAGVTELPALTAEEIVKLAKSIEELADSIVKSAEALEARKAKLKELLGESKKIADALKSSTGKKVGNVVGAVAGNAVAGAAMVAGLTLINPAILPTLFFLMSTGSFAGGGGAVVAGMTAGQVVGITAGAKAGGKLFGGKVDKINTHIRKYLKGINKISNAILQPDLLVQRQAIGSGKAAFNYAVKSLSNLK